MSSGEESYIMDTDRWTSDNIVEYYFDHLPTTVNPPPPTLDTKLPPLQRRDSSRSSRSRPSSTLPYPPTSSSFGSMLTAPPLEKTDSQWSPLSSGLVTPQDSIGNWTCSFSPDRRRSGRFSVDSNGGFGQSNRWSLGTQLSSVSFAELPAAVPCEEDKGQEWTPVESSVDSFTEEEEEDDNIFHPDDEIIVDPKESMEAPIKRASIGTRTQTQEWPLNEPILKTVVPPIDPRFRQIQGPLSPPLKPTRQQLQISTISDPLLEDSSSASSYSIRNSTFSFSSDPTTSSFKYHSYDPSMFPKVTNRRSFVESPPEIFANEPSWPLTTNTAISPPSLWPPPHTEKALPPTPRSRGVSLSSQGYRMSGSGGTVYAQSSGTDSGRTIHVSHQTMERPASWNPRQCDEVFDLNLEKAILGTSLARDHRLQQRRAEDQHQHQHQNLATMGIQDDQFETVLNTLKISDLQSNRSSVSGSLYRDSLNGGRNYTWSNGEEYQQRGGGGGGIDRRSSIKEQSLQAAVTKAQRERSIINRIVNERGLNPSQFDTSPKHARFFVIKSYNEDDVQKSFKFNIWASTEIGNRRLDKAYRESYRAGPIYLFFSVNASGQFCGMARMMSPVDYNKNSSVWTQVDKWKGRMDVRWIFVKDIPNPQLRHIRVWNNENKPVTNSRDTQELPPEAGVAMLRIFADYPPTKSVILTTLATAEMKEDGGPATDDRHASLQSVDELSGGGYNGRQSLPATIGSGMEEFGMRPVHHASTEPMFPRQSWQSLGTVEDSMRSSGRQSYHFDVQDYSSRDSRASQTSLNRRNTISSIGPIGSSNRLSTPLISSTATNASIRTTPDTTFLPTSQSRFHDPQTTSSSSSYRSVLSGLGAGLGDIYTSNRYPPFHTAGQTHEKTMAGAQAVSRYDEELRYF